MEKVLCAPAGPNIALSFLRLFVCTCASALITSAIITSHTLLPCDFTLVNLAAALSTDVATMSSLAELRVWDTKKQRQHRCNDTRLTESRNARRKQLLMMPTEQLTIWEWLPGELWNIRLEFFGRWWHSNLTGGECSLEPDRPSHAFESIFVLISVNILVKI